MTIFNFDPNRLARETERSMRLTAASLMLHEPSLTEEEAGRLISWGTSLTPSPAPTFRAGTGVHPVAGRDTCNKA